jgi:hypothetical protein
VTPRYIRPRSKFGSPHFNFLGISSCFLNSQIAFVSVTVLSVTLPFFFPALFIWIYQRFRGYFGSNIVCTIITMSNDEAVIKQLENALALQKKAFLKNQCPSAEERKANIAKIPAMVLSNRDAIREAMNTDFGSHPTATIDMIEVLGVAGRAAYAISKVDEWIKYDSREVDAQWYGSTAKGEVRYQPKGVIGNIVRMYPMSLTYPSYPEQLCIQRHTMY